MTTPYLRLRWVRDLMEENAFTCHYELVMPLGESDIRREVWSNGECISKRDKLIIPMSSNSTRRTGSVPCINEGGGYYYDAPFRDGAHAKWDSEKLGGIPVRVMALDGTLMEMVDNQLVFC